jgi:hypothetical protein
VAAPSVKSITMRDAKNIFGKIAKSNHYVVSFSTLNKKLTDHLKNNYGGTSVADKSFISRNLGLLCSDASLPTSSFATAEVKDNYMGVPQEFAHTRLYTDIDFTFYVDSDYTTLRIFEGWMDYISGGGPAQSPNENYFRRFNYPDDYKVSTMYITKVERNLGPQLDYQFINAFPKGMTAIPVSYGGADLLKVTVSFNYDRYIVSGYKKEPKTRKPKSTIINPDTALQLDPGLREKLGSRFNTLAARGDRLNRAEADELSRLANILQSQR